MSSEVWAAVGAISALISALSTLISFLFFSMTIILAYVQLKEMATARSVEALSGVIDKLSSPEMSKARRYVLTEDLPPPEDVPSEVYEILYSVWVSFNQVGLMVAFKLIPERLVFEMYYGSIIRCWLRLEPYIQRERQTRRGVYQKHFEDLYRRSVAFRDKYYPHQQFDEWHTGEGRKLP